MLRIASILQVVFLTLSASLVAQDYFGTFSAVNDQGGQTVVTLQQAANGSVTGSISGNGNQFLIEGVLEEGSLVGTVTVGQQGGLWLEAQLNGDQLLLTLIEPDASGMPNYSTATTLHFTRTGSASASAGSNSATRKPAKGDRQATANPMGQGGSCIAYLAQKGKDRI